MCKGAEGWQEEREEAFPVFERGVCVLPDDDEMDKEREVSPVLFSAMQACSGEVIGDIE